MKVKLRFEFCDDYTDASELMLFDEANPFFKQLGFEHSGGDTCDDGKLYEYAYEGVNPSLNEIR
jgi:hypothetical protein